MTKARGAEAHLATLDGANRDERRATTLDVNRIIDQALVHHKAGRLTEAERLYREVLAVDPKHADSLHLLGTISHQVGRHDVAVDLIGKAIALNDRAADYHCNMGSALCGLGRRQEAIAYYLRAIDIDSGHAPSFNNLGNALVEQGSLREGEERLRRALELQPDYYEAHYNLGNALAAQDILDEAVAHYRRALALAPGFANARKNLAAALEKQGKLDPANASSSGNGVAPAGTKGQSSILLFARLLQPKRVLGFEKVRVGRDFDGGYILVDDFSAIDGALSFGVSDDASWDLDIAQRNIPVHQFDHTIDRGPVDHTLIHFHKVRVAETDAPGAACLDTLVERLLSKSKRALLKIDIEGDEWGVLNAASPNSLDRFAQIACELHGFRLLADPDWYDRCEAAITKLKALFEVVHVHGNNAQPFTNIANVMLPSLLEVTFANRSCYQFTETDEVFPTPLDRPNLPDRPDLILGCFKF